MKLNFNITFRKATVAAGSATNTGCGNLVPNAVLLTVGEVVAASAISSCIAPGLAADSEFDIFLNVILNRCF